MAIQPNVVSYPILEYDTDDDLDYDVIEVGKVYDRPFLRPPKSSACAISEPTNSYLSSNSRDFLREQSLSASRNDIYSKSDIQSNASVYSLAPKTHFTITNKGEQKSNKANREFIDTVRNQIKLLQNTLVAVDRDNECDNETSCDNPKQQGDRNELIQGKCILLRNRAVLKNYFITIYH